MGVNETEIEHFDFLEAVYFHAILASDSLQTCTDALKHASVILDAIFFVLFCVVTLVFTLSCTGVKKLLELHPDLIQHAVSITGLFFQTHLTGSLSFFCRQKPETAPVS